MKIPAGIICLLLFSHPVFCQEKANSDSMEVHVDGKIFVTLTYEQINSTSLSIPLQSGWHKISWVRKPPGETLLVPYPGTLPGTEVAMLVFFINSKMRVKNYSEF